MATLTSQILIGSPHPNHGGIGPSHYLFLSENSRPAWILVNQNLDKDTSRNELPIIWIPTIENTLEDAFLMIGIYVCNDKDLEQLALQYNPEIKNSGIELYEYLNGEQREKLYERVRKLSDFPKIIISAFKGSLIIPQLHAITAYSMDVEVCTPTFSRLYSAWNKNHTIEGDLESI